MAARSLSAARILKSVRDLMKNYQTGAPLACIIVPTDDPHLSEYVSERYKRRHFVSRFTGSQGTAVITHDQACLWADGRYFLQAEQQLDPSMWTLMKQHTDGCPTVEEWVRNTLSEGDAVGVDASTFSYSTYESMQKKLDKKGIKLVPTSFNLIDVVRAQLEGEGEEGGSGGKVGGGERRYAEDGRDRKKYEDGIIFHHPIAYTGMSTKEKLKKMGEKMKEKEADHMVVTQLDDVALLLNIRGTDVCFSPFAFAFAIVNAPTDQGGSVTVDVFLNEAKLTKEARDDLSPFCTFHAYESMTSHLRHLVSKQGGASVKGGSKHIPEKEGMKKREKRTRRIWLDPVTSNAGLTQIVKNAVNSTSGKRESGSMDEEGDKDDGSFSVEMVEGMLPIVDLKLNKTEAELNAIQEGHRYDGAALFRFFHWLEKQVEAGVELDEVDAAEKELEFRREHPAFFSLSFDTISGSGEKGAIIHYKPEKKSAAKIEKGKIYLNDSGAQYIIGATTDTTRTWAFQEPTPHQKTCCTLVLKAHVGLAKQVFPAGVFARQFDTLSRSVMWNAGIDFQHGVGHGVGSFANVHEALENFIISLRPSRQEVGVKKNLVVTIEPGYYEGEGEDAFGCRHENVMVVREAKEDEGVLKRIRTATGAKKKENLSFVPVTLVPFNRLLIDVSLMTEDEIAYIDAYHQRVYEEISPLLSNEKEVLDALVRHTRPLRAV